MVIGEGLAEKRNLVLELYERYKRQKESLLRDLPNENDGIDDEYLESKVNSIKSGKFIVAVVGEAKAGKSTFINALLGEEILPIDLLQATSAIIEISKSDTMFLKIEFADGHTEEFTNTTEIKDKLTTFAKLSDEYRPIPTTLIEDEIINSEDKLTVDDSFIEKLEEKSNLEDLREKKDLIIQFIKERPKNKIPVQITVGYPVPWMIDEIRIYDTPGVQVTGGVQDRTYKFLSKADAILFIHRIIGFQAEHFKKFFKGLREKVKENIFLILTQFIKETNEEGKKKLLETAKNDYKALIKKDRIFAVDSIIKLIYEKIKRNNFQVNEEVNKMLKSLSGDVREEIEEMIKNQDFDGLLSYSGFKEFYQELEQFLSTAPYNRLLEVVKKIKEGFENQYKLYESNINLLKNKLRKPPQEFFKELNEIENELNTLENKYKVELGKLRQDSIPQEIISLGHEIERLREDYVTKINDSTEHEEIRKYAYDFIDKLNDMIDLFYEKIKSEITEKVKIAVDEFYEQTGIYIPQIDMDKIEKEAKKKAYIKTIIYEDRPWDFWDIITGGLARIFRNNKIKKEQKGSDPKKYIENLKYMCTIEIQKIRDNLGNDDNLIIQPIKEILEKVEAKLDENINRKKEALIEIENELRDAEETQKKIEHFEMRNKSIEEELDFCNQIKEDIECLLK